MTTWYEENFNSSSHDKEKHGDTLTQQKPKDDNTQRYRYIYKYK